MAKGIEQYLSKYHLDIINNLNLTYDLEFTKPLSRLTKTSINNLIKLNNLDYAKVISYNFTDAIVTLRCNKTSNIYQKNIYINQDYCGCQDCTRDRRLKASKAVWERPNYKEHQRKVQAKVWERPNYKEHQKNIQTLSHSDESYKLMMRNKMKDKYKNKDYRLNNLIKNAEKHRKYPAKDELEFINKLISMNIKYEWQYPILLREEIGFDVIMDFYLPDYDIFININTDGFHRDFEGVIKKDNKLKQFFGDKLKILNELNDSDNLLKEVISQ